MQGVKGKLGLSCADQAIHYMHDDLGVMGCRTAQSD